MVEQIGRVGGVKPAFIKGDILDQSVLRPVFAGQEIEMVIHLAGVKDVGESSANPLKYYQNNVAGTVQLLNAMNDFGCKKLIFSSSAAVYGQECPPPFREDSPLKPMNVYGHTKLSVEHLLADLCRSDSSWKALIFRYANPVGAHKSGFLGEPVRKSSGNLIPMLVKAALDQIPKLRVYGKDYATPDGTGIRDYLHIMDLAEAHVKGIDFLEGSFGLETFNLGTGRGYSVLEVLNTFRQVSGKELDVEYSPRRPGDVAQCWLEPAKARQLLGWQAQRDLTVMCRDSWNYALKTRLDKSGSYLG